MKQKYEVSYLETKIKHFWKINNINSNLYLNNIFNNSKITANQNFCILLPPPNITGNLHLGHALQYTIMDILVRYNLMLKKNTLWQAGLDHAGIATQLIVEQYLNNCSSWSHSHDQQLLLDELIHWKDKYANQIIEQMQNLGCCLDWTNYRFTMDKKYCNAVITAFIKLYEDGLIYKAQKLVNWDPLLKTAISDIELNNKYTNGYIWYIKYEVLDSHKHNNLIIATTRPETLLGDVALAVNPKDIRYHSFIGKFAIVPIIKRIIPIISDDYVQINKYSGCVKITPAHDFNDYEIAKKYNLPIIKIFDKQAKSYKQLKLYTNYLKQKPSYESIPLAFQSLNRFILRKKIIKQLIYLKLITKIEKCLINQTINIRNNQIIEPRLTVQWYLKTKYLSTLASKAINNQQINLIPKHYEKMYFAWVKNIKDWCISRQIIWGHRIPVWYDEVQHIYVGEDEQTVRTKYKLDSRIKLLPETDVLDTWFASSLWGFASLGWPYDSKLLKCFFPTTVLVSGFDIIFFWIIRMIMMSMYFIKNTVNKPLIPFKNIFLTGLICDSDGEKMSKSKGNVIDPLDLIKGISLKKIIAKKIKTLLFKSTKSIKTLVKVTKQEFPNGIEAYGADALRLTLTSLAIINKRDLKWNMTKLVNYKYFCNKLWNASLFILLNVKTIPYLTNYFDKLSILDVWILIKLNNTINSITIALNHYKFDIVVHTMYKFIKNYFCDWYLELIKPILSNKIRMSNSSTIVKVIKLTLINVLTKILKISHPFIPYITEAIWQKLLILTKSAPSSIITELFPKLDLKIALINKNCLIEPIINYFQKLIICCRNFRNKYKLSSSITFKKIILWKVPSDFKGYIIQHTALLSYLLNTKLIVIDDQINNHDPNNINIIIDNLNFSIIMNNPIFANEILNQDFINKINKLKTLVNYFIKKLTNKHFIKHAPKQLIKQILINYKKNKIMLQELIKQQFKLNNLAKN